MTGLGECPSMQEGYTITEQQFYLASPDYPLPFPTGAQCVWIIAPNTCSAGQRIIFDIDVVSTAPDCQHSLLINPVNGTEKRLCGTQEEVNVAADGCTAAVVFDARTGQNTAGRGFFMSYTGITY
jgi:hypothetical protein